MASAGSLEPLGRYGVGGLPTDTFVSAVTAPADVGDDQERDHGDQRNSNPMRRVIVDPFSRHPHA